MENLQKFLESQKDELEKGNESLKKIAYFACTGTTVDLVLTKTPYLSLTSDPEFKNLYEPFKEWAVESTLK